MSHSSPSHFYLRLSVVVAVASTACGPTTTHFGAVSVKLVSEPGQDALSEVDELVVTVTPDVGTAPSPFSRPPSAKLSLTNVVFDKRLTVSVDGKKNNRTLSQAQGDVVPELMPTQLNLVLKRLPGPRELVSQPSVARARPFTFALPDGRILVVGGTAEPQRPEVIDPATNQFSALPLVKPLRPGAAFALAGTQLYVVGGRENSDVVGDVEAIDLSSLLVNTLG